MAENSGSLGAIIGNLRLRVKSERPFPRGASGKGQNAPEPFHTALLPPSTGSNGSPLTVTQMVTALSSVSRSLTGNDKKQQPHIGAARFGGSDVRLWLIGSCGACFLLNPGLHPRSLAKKRTGIHTAEDRNRNDHQKRPAS